MESIPTSNTVQAITTKDFLDLLKDFMTESVVSLSAKGLIPNIMRLKKKKRRESEGSGSGSDSEV